MNSEDKYVVVTESKDLDEWEAGITDALKARGAYAQTKVRTPTQFAKFLPLTGIVSSRLQGCKTHKQCQVVVGGGHNMKSMLEKDSITNPQETRLIIGTSVTSTVSRPASSS